MPTIFVVDEIVLDNLNMWALCGKHFSSVYKESDCYEIKDINEHYIYVGIYKVLIMTYWVTEVSKGAMFNAIKVFKPS